MKPEVVLKERLYAPGPVEVPPQVLAALARPVAHHRSPAFIELFGRARRRLSELFRVEGEDVLIVTGSGTAGFEAALGTALAPGSQVLSLCAGKFGERWAKLAARLGHDVRTLTAEYGSDFDSDELARVLEAAPRLDAVTVVHSETSTGVLHDVERIAGAVRAKRPQALVIVDAVTSLGAAELLPLAWGLDGVVSGSQKGVMSPPGLGFVWLSGRAWERAAAAGPSGGAGSGSAATDRGATGHGSSSYYLDLRRELPMQRKGETAFTPAVSLVAALDAALELLSAVPIEDLWGHRARLNEAVLSAGEALGMRRFAQRSSPAVAALTAPDGVAAPALVGAMLRRGVTAAGGQDALRGTLLRPSLLGWSDRYDAVVVAAALEDALREVAPALDFRRGAGVAAALGALDGS